MFLSARDPHLHIALHGEEVSLHRKRMCLIHELEVELLDHLSDELVQFDLWRLAYYNETCIGDLPLQDHDPDRIVVQCLRN
jgi:hypothetical protein